MYEIVDIIYKIIYNFTYEIYKIYIYICEIIYKHNYMKLLYYHIIYN